MKPLTLQEVITACIKHNHKYVSGWVKSSENYAAKPELASDVDNGITLCNVCHTQLHSKYGYNVGKDNLNGITV